LASCVERESDRVPEPVTGEPETEKIAGADSETLVTAGTAELTQEVPLKTRTWFVEGEGTLTFARASRFAAAILASAAAEKLVTSEAACVWALGAKVEGMPVSSE
jgi:hypothetical protein